MREPVLRKGASVVALALVSLAGPSTQAALAIDSARLFVGESACPRPQEVLAALRTLIPADRLDRRLTASGGAPFVVQLIDLGIRYRIVAAGSMREYRDEARDCAYRARVAAVFVALTLDPGAPPPPPPAAPSSSQRAEAPSPAEASPVRSPPSSGFPAPPIPVPAATTVPISAPSFADPAGVAVSAGAASPPESAVAARVSGGNRVTAQVGASLQLGLATSDHIIVPGLGLGLVAGRGDWSFVAGAVLSPAVDTVVGGLRLSEWRLPADLGVRRRFTGPSWIPYAEAGLGLSLVRARALALAANESETSAELGLHGGLGVYPARPGRVTPYAAVHVEYVPDPSAVSALPRGVIGHTSTMWVGAALGASIDL